MLVAENVVAECHDSLDGNEPAPSMTAVAVPVMWEQGGEAMQIASVQSNDGAPIELTITVPATATPGEALISLQTATLELTVE